MMTETPVEDADKFGFNIRDSGAKRKLIIHVSSLRDVDIIEIRLPKMPEGDEDAQD